MKRTVVEYVERWASGGIESYILNLIRYLSKEKFEVRIVVAQKETDIYDKELSEYGVEVESLLETICINPVQRMLLNQKLFRKFISENYCDVLHLHVCQGVALRYGKIAKKAGVKKVISHCHNTEIGGGQQYVKMTGHKLGKLLYRKYIDQMIACSDLAARWLYTKNDIRKGRVIISKYIVDVDKFSFSMMDRENFRNRYKISMDTKVYLNVGRFHYQKNQIFLLDIFKEIWLLEPQSVFFLIGEGELKEKIHGYAKQIGIYENIIFVDRTREINRYMSMADAFLLPSLFEGNPIVGIEAQASGLVCIFSDSITKQAKVIDTTEFIKINEPASEWAKKILKQQALANILKRTETVEELKKSGYDIAQQIVEIEKLYT